MREIRLRRFGAPLLRLVAAVFAITAATAAEAADYSYETVKSAAAAGQNAGWTSVVSGDWMLMGEPSISNPASAGTVSIYQRNGSSWNYFGSLTSPDTANADKFGAALAMDGDTIVVGAPGASPGGNLGAGRAYAYRRLLLFQPFPPYNSYYSFDFVAELVAPSITAGDEFGFSVAISGDTAVVGAPDATRHQLRSSYPQAGYAAIYQRNSGGAEAWGRTGSIFGDLNANDQFGYAVAISGTTLLIGSPYARVTPAGTTYNSGRGWFFILQGNGTAVYDYYVGTQTPANNRAFGAAVAIDGDIAAIGAPGFAGGYPASVDTFVVSGGAFLYAFSKQLTSPYSDTNPADAFGGAVAVLGTQLLVGAPAETFLSKTNVGETYLYDRDNGGSDAWGLQQGIPVESCVLQYYYDGTNQELRFGSSVSFDATTLIGGAPFAAYGGAIGVGAVFVYSTDKIFANSFEVSPIVLCG